MKQIQSIKPQSISLPKKPKIRLKEQQPDQRQFSVVPIRAITDRKLTEMQLRVLLMFCCYTNKGGLTWVGLQRIADHFGISLNRAAVHGRELVKKGYIRILYKGYTHIRAHTRQVIYKADMSLEDIVAITGEPAPYMVEQQQLTTGAKGEKMSKRKKQVTDPSVSNLEKIDCQQTSDRMTIDEMIAIRRSVGDEVFEVALSRAGTGASIEQIQAELRRMLS